jgi:hypothetical protein
MSGGAWAKKGGRGQGFRDSGHHGDRRSSCTVNLVRANRAWDRFAVADGCGEARRGPGRESRCFRAAVIERERERGRERGPQPCGPPPASSVRAGSGWLGTAGRAPRPGGAALGAVHGACRRVSGAPRAAWRGGRCPPTPLGAGCQQQRVRLRRERPGRRAAAGQPAPRPPPVRAGAPVERGGRGRKLPSATGGGRRPGRGPWPSIMGRPRPVVLGRRNSPHPMQACSWRRAARRVGLQESARKADAWLCARSGKPTGRRRGPRCARRSAGP